MCYSPEVSFGTWGLGMIAALYLYSNQKPFLFPFVVSQMQLIEGLRWVHRVDESILAILGKLALYAQPVAALYEAKQFSLISPYLIAISLSEYLFGSRDLRFTIAKDGHFQWNWGFKSTLAALPYWIGLLVGTSYLLPTSVILFMAALFLYYYITHQEYKTYGSLWCVSVNILWIYYLVRDKPFFSGQ
jgi:hypothetical protein